MNLKRIYQKIPDFNCKEGCSECCGPHPWSLEEARKIRRFLKKCGLKERFVKFGSLSCPYIENERCIIYPVRPLMCRLYGAVEGLKCPFGCGPEKLLMDKEAGKMIHVVYGAVFK